MIDSLVEHTAQLSDRGLGSLQVQSNISQSAHHLAMAQATRNLLIKARRDLASGQIERADSYIVRALRLPHHDESEAPAGVQEAHMMLFTIVADALDESDQDASPWLDTVEAILPQCGETAREGLRWILRTLDHDYRLQPSERRRIRSIAPGTYSPDDENTFLNQAGNDEAAHRAVITEFLLAADAYETEFNRLGSLG